ncbi:MAG: type IV pilus inner membrane component PilO [Deltaproteobacteria bacterium]
MEQFLDRIVKVRWEIKLGVLLGSILLMFAANYFFFISDLQDEIARQDVQSKRLEDDLIQKQSIANNLNEYRRQKEVLEQRLAEALTELPNDANIDELLSQLNEVGVRSGLELASVEPGTESNEGSFYSKIPVKLSVVGNYHEIASFFDAVGRLKRIVNISEISLKSPTKQGDKVVLKADCLATTFRFVDKSPGAAKAGGVK